MELIIKNKNIFVLLFFLVWFLLHTIFIRDNFENSALSKFKLKKSFNFLPKSYNIESSDEAESKKKLAILVPLRNALNELIVFIPKITTFLSQHEIPFAIILINQIDTFRFNRGALLNVGFLYVKNDFDYVIFHDVDIYPLKMNISYEYPDNNSVFHLIPYYLHPNQNVDYENYLGGILAVPNHIYELVDGTSNDFWGWGGEDDEFFTVLKKMNITINRSDREIGNRSNSFVHMHNKMRHRDTESCKGQNRLTFDHREPNSGLNSTKYLIKSSQRIMIDESEAILLNVELKCDRAKTPWCDECN